MSEDAISRLRLKDQRLTACLNELPSEQKEIDILEEELYRVIFYIILFLLPIVHVLIF